MYLNGPCAIDAVPRDGFQTHPRPMEYHGRDRRYAKPHHRQCTRPDSEGIDSRLNRKIKRRFDKANFSVNSGNGTLVTKGSLQNPASSLGPGAEWLTDEKASRRVEMCFKKRQNQLAGRILWKQLNCEQALGQESLDNIRYDTDTVFFGGMLRGKVKWRWSEEGEEEYENELLGSTTPQYSSETGIEARIVLSRPLLLSGRYSRDLLLSTFIHELVHCYLFICCGDQAQKDGGHTPGFQRIVQLINGWIGNSRLRLCSMKADRYSANGCVVQTPRTVIGRPVAKLSSRISQPRRRAYISCEEWGWRKIGRQADVFV